MGITFFIPTQRNPQVYNSTGGRVPLWSLNLAEPADILAAVPVFRQASSAQWWRMLNVSRVMGWPQTC